jgi:predicted TIM-barrel fold metal-dependent hydrolase
LERYPDIRLILSHAGGFLPFASQRIARSVSPDGTDEPGLARLRKFHLDTALASSPYALPSLLAFTDVSHITFGSDLALCAAGTVGRLYRAAEPVST